MVRLRMLLDWLNVRITDMQTNTIHLYLSGIVTPSCAIDAYPHGDLRVIRKVAEALADGTARAHGKIGTTKSADKISL